MELDLEEFDPQEAINEVLAIVSVMALKKQIGLGVRPGDSVPTIKADRGKFRQILYNLLSNAVKFTPEGGMVEVQTRQVADRIEISVIDNGIGISPEDHERIFEEFRMLDNVLTKRTQGTGLGLALSRKLAQLHGGTIGVQSAAGQGSIFTFNLPIFPLEKGAETARQPGLKAPPPEQNSYNKDGSPEARPGEKVALVVEDDDKAAEILQLYLEQSGYRVARATTGEAALAQAKELKPAVISLDILLPAKNGLEVLRELQADPTTRDIPVLVVSMTDNRQISFELGAVAFFAKPVYRQELTAKLQDLQLNELHQRRRKHVQHGEPLRALVIDDNPHDRELITTALTAAGLTVATAPDGETGWQMAQRNPPDLVVLDLMMPELDGFEVLSRLRQHEGTFEVPVFIYTAKELDLQERTRLDHEAEAVLQKGDFSRQTLLEAVERLTLHGD